jgi:hypothetical protein
MADQNNNSVATFVMPTSALELKSRFAHRERLMTDELQDLLLEIYDSEPEISELLAPIEDADASEGSLRDNFDKAVSLVIDFAKAHQNKYGLVARAKRISVRKGFNVVLRRAKIDLTSRRRIAYGGDAAHIEAAE